MQADLVDWIDTRCLSYKCDTIGQLLHATFVTFVFIYYPDTNNSEWFVIVLAMFGSLGSRVDDVYFRMMK